MKILSVLILLLAFNANAVTNYFVHLKANNSIERSRISSLIHIDSVISDSVYSVVNEFDFLKLKNDLPDLIVESHPMPVKPSRSEEVEFPAGDENFHTYKEVVSSLTNLEKKYPQLAKTFSIGKSVEGVEIIGIRITHSENRKLNIPGILFTGTHHAREHLSTEVPTKLVTYLLENYETNQQVKNLINNRDIYIIPVINPDGTTYDIKGRNYKMWRKNRALNQSTYGVDLNRNYSHGWGTGGSSTSPSSDVYMGPKAFSEPETTAVKNFVETHPNLRILLTYHTYSELILYPWGGKYDGVGGRDEEVFKTMAQTMSAWNGYTPEQASDLYIASGDTCDWAYGDHGIFCFTFELSPKNTFGGGGFYPGAGVIEKTFTSNIKPALYLIDHSSDPYAILNVHDAYFY